jgi:hypothetical protein
MRDSGESGEDVVSTPYQSKVYTDTPATRSPLLTVVLAIVILAILTLLALTVIRWVGRSKNVTLMRSDSISRNIPGDVAGIFRTRKVDYEQFLQ